MSQPGGVIAALVRLVLLPLVAALLLTWWVVGDVSEAGGYDSVARVPLAQDHAVWLGLAGLVLAAGVIADVSRWGPQRGSRPGWAAILSAGTGVGIGAALRVITAKTYGANIGAGMLILYAPFVVVPALGVAMSWAVRAGRKRPRPGSLRYVGGRMVS